MIKVKAKYIVLYTIGITLLIFGQRDFWEKIQEASKQKEISRKQTEEAQMASNKKFEIQELTYDSVRNKWINQHVYFQTQNMGNVNFKLLKRSANIKIETNDDENASDSF